MALTDQLAAYYDLGQRFDQGILAINSAPSGLYPLRPRDIDPTYRFPNPGPSLIAADGGSASFIAYNSLGTTRAMLHRLAAEAPFRLLGDRTFTFWFRYNRVGVQPFNQGIFFNGVGALVADYAVVLDPAIRQLKFGRTTGLITHPDVIQEGQIYFGVLYYRHAESRMYLKLNDGIPASGPISVVNNGFDFVIGDNGNIEGDVDELGIWERVLTATEMTRLFNDGDGMSYADIVAESSTQPCRSLECCNDNPASYVSAGGEGKGYDSLCEPLPRVLFEPLSGTRLIMPSLVALRSDNPNAVIHYTMDGSVPDRNSAIYTTPLTVSSPAEIIRAIAIVNGCPEGPESNAQYLQWSPAAHWTYSCGVVDKAGQWGAFALDGSPDYNWQLQLQVTASTSIQQFDILQLFPDGIFTGSGWSTREYIYPWEDTDLAHRSFPLVLWSPDHTGVQVNFAYQENFSAAYGNLAPGSHILTMYGAPWTGLPTDHLFKLRIVFTDGSTLERLIDTTCDVLPPALCPVPDFDNAGYSCGPPKSIDLTYSLTIGTARKIFRATSSIGPFTELVSGLVGASPETYQDQTIVADQDYYYYLSHIPTGCTEYVNGPVRLVTALRLPNVSIAANPSTINAGSNTTINWNSSFISGTVTITPTIGAQPGNVAGSQVVAPAVTTVYEISGQNFCGDVETEQVTVTVIQTPFCAAIHPVTVSIQDYTDAFFNISACSGLRLRPDPAWNGTFLNFTVGCHWMAADFNQSIQNRHLDVVNTNVRIAAGLWQVTVSLFLSTGGTVELWRGVKSFGGTPLGTYTRVAGCATTTPSLTLV